MVTILLGFAAVNTGNNLLFLVVAGLLAFMSATGYVGMLNIKGIMPQLLPPDELFARTPARFRLVVSNDKLRIPSFLIRLSTPIGETLLPFLAAGAEHQTRLDLVFPQRGEHAIGTVRISSCFPVNFFTRSWEFQLHDTVLVCPQPLNTAYPLEAEHAEQSGEQSSVRLGQDGELERITTYSGREPLRAIHWKHAARSRELLVKQFGSSAAPPLVINPLQLPGSDLEEQLSRATWLICNNRQRQIGLMLGDQLIPPASGNQHVALLLKELALYGRH